MHRRKIILVGFALFISGSAHAGDLGWAGALSGAGNAMGQSMQQMQNAIIQEELMRQQAEAQQKRDEQSQRWQREREERAYQAQRDSERVGREQAERAERDQVWKAPKNEPETPTVSNKSAIQDLTRLHPDWRTILGANGSSTSFRQWLTTKTPTYQELILTTSDPYLVGDAIDRFQLESRFATPLLDRAGTEKTEDVTRVTARLEQDFQQSRQKEADALNAEARSLNEEKRLLDEKRQDLLRWQEQDIPRFNAEIVEFNKAGIRQKQRIADHNERLADHNKRWRITASPTAVSNPVSIQTPIPVQPSVQQTTATQEQREVWANDWKNVSHETSGIFRGWLVRHPKEYKEIWESKWDPAVVGRLLANFKVETGYQERQASAK